MSPDKEWHLIDANGRQCGPYTEEQLHGYANDGTIAPTTLLWADGLEDWIPASDVPGLFRNQPKWTAAQVAQFIKGPLLLWSAASAAGILGIYGLVTGNAFMIGSDDGPSFWADREKDPFFYWAIITVELLFFVGAVAAGAVLFQKKRNQKNKPPS
jgi:hypothetical protein